MTLGYRTDSMRRHRVRAAIVRALGLATAFVFVVTYLAGRS